MIFFRREFVNEKGELEVESVRGIYDSGGAVVVTSGTWGSPSWPKGTHVEVLFVCDRCGKKAPAGPVSAPGRWSLPPGWDSKDMGEWEMHGCTKEHLDELVERARRKSGPTPASTSTGFPI